MAGNHEGDRVRGAGPRHGPRPGRLADAARNLAVGSRLADGDRPQLLPHAALEGRRPQVDGQGGGGLLSLDALEHASHPGAHDGVVPAHFRRRILGAQGRLQRGVRVAEAHRRNASIGGGHQQASQRRFGDGVGDAHSLSALAVRAGRHPEA